MKIVIASDLHLSSCESVDNFGSKQEQKFLLFCDKILKEKIDKFIIAGDMYELFQGSGWTESKRYDLIKKRYCKIENKLKELKQNKIEVYFISGNHDYYLKEKFGCKTELLIEDSNKKILILHGHIFDDQYKNNISTYIGRVATEFWGFCESVFGKERMGKILPMIEPWIERENIKNKKSAQKMSDEKYVNKAIAYAKKRSVDIICIGHTHRAKIESKENILYMNSGTWIDSNSDFIYIDTEQTHFVLEKFE